ncbi:hypothetical protein GCM10025868_46820 [Angustibacter aerolatus]|uniref:Uncharacterized protein n=1 Tax=Angustibacter aerolatus TaxID=1162965 RepID=A0ABQ6JQ47_9ACTN|nr:hypothetical protein GCM10025868_46400 [Angustibacter aerolatus]GMA89432.1 hypothetical protein GCM10025868_46820 [Angustibacter aerolatus]
MSAATGAYQEVAGVDRHLVGRGCRGGVPLLLPQQTEVDRLQGVVGVNRHLADPEDPFLVVCGTQPLVIGSRSFLVGANGGRRTGDFALSHS